MMNGNRILAAMLLVLNAVVLLGQILPESAPPFARAVNIATLIANVVVLIWAMRRPRSA